MDYTAQMVLDHVQVDAGSLLHVTRIRPSMPSRLRRLPIAPDVALNADRLFGRFYDYPRALRSDLVRFDLFHIVDHSYGHLASEIPGDRTIVTCHEPTHSARFSNVAGVFGRRFCAEWLNGSPAGCAVPPRSCASVRQHATISRGSASSIHAVSKSFPTACIPSARRFPILTRRRGRPSVRERPADDPCPACGSAIARKRIDILLRVFAEASRQRDNLILVRVGPLTNDQWALAAQLGVTHRIRQLSQLSTRLLCAVYRRAAVVLQPSEREGFGLPVAEALACGTPVIASDIPALRQVGGDAVDYCRVGDVEAWSAALLRVIDAQTNDMPESARRRAAAISQAARFSWAAHARQLVRIYRDLL